MTKLSECEIAPVITSEWAKQFFLECVVSGRKAVPEASWLNADLSTLRVEFVHGTQTLVSGVIRCYHDHEYTPGPHKISRIDLHMMIDPLNKEIHYIGYSEYENTIFVWQKDVEDGSQV